MNSNYIDGAALVQENLDVRPKVGHLTYPAGLTDFQQTEFDWALRLRAECKRDEESGTTVLRYIRVDEVQEMHKLIVSEPGWECRALFRGFMVEKDEDRICPRCASNTCLPYRR